MHVPTHTIKYNICRFNVFLMSLRLANGATTSYQIGLRGGTKVYMPLPIKDYIQLKWYMTDHDKCVWSRRSDCVLGEGGGGGEGAAN